jgi:hypothetical protein
MAVWAIHLGGCVGATVGTSGAVVLVKRKRKALGPEPAQNL